MLRISTYRELESNNELLPLMDQAFHSPFNPREFEKLVDVDPRSKDGPVGFCALKNGHVIGFVGVWDLPTRNVDEDTEYIGGIYGVTTLPGHERTGICTALMNAAHEYFRKRDYRFSFLSTMPTLVAYDLYQKLGYVNVTEFPSAYKIVQDSKIRICEDAKDFDLDKILRIFHAFSKTKTGLVIRDEEYLKTIMKIERLDARNCMLREEGYVIFKRDKNGTQIKEIIALTTRELEKLVKHIEDRARGAVYDRAVMNSELLQFYQSRDYMILSRSYGVIMVKPLTADASFEQIYGDRFCLSGLDIGC